MRGRVNLLSGMAQNWAAAAVAKAEMMTCPACDVRWKGKAEPCWVCDRSGVPLYKDDEKKEALGGHEG